MTEKKLSKISCTKQISYIYSWTCPKCGQSNKLETINCPTRTTYFSCSCGEILGKWDIIIDKKYK